MGPSESVDRLIQDLRTHQLELEVQNEELRRTQQKLEAARQSYSDLFVHAPIGYCTLDLEGRVLQVNPAACALLGLKPAQLVGQKLGRYVFSEDQDDYYLQLRGLPYQEQACSWELRLLQPPSKACWVQFTAAAGQGLDGSDLVRLTLVGVEERHRAAEEKARLEAQLQQARKLDSIGRLAGGIAHDFNNMLFVILGNADLIADREDLEESVRSELQEIRAAAQRSAETTAQLLAFARQQVVAPRALDLNEAVAQVYKMLSRLIGEDIELRWHPVADLWPVKIDPTQFDQILTNLCLNARDAIAGGGRIEVELANCVLQQECEPDAPSGDYVLMQVSDNGCGMPPEVLENIFEPFFTTKELGQGTGLGLATIYGSVRQNHGLVRVTSQPGQGSCFKVYLPRFAGLTPSVAPLETGPRGRTSQERRILVVEDEAAVLVLTCNMLEKGGYQVLRASNPGQALEIARNSARRLDVLLTDVVLPEMHGRDLANRIKSLHPNLRCVFMSGYPADVVTRQGILEAGLPFLQKPFTSLDLLAKIRQALEPIET